MGREFGFVFRSLPLMPTLIAGADHESRIGVVRYKDDLTQRQVLGRSTAELWGDPRVVAFSCKK
jgi:hypothetical protein